MSGFQFDIESLPLPPPWRYEVDVDENTWFVNTHTDERTLEHPFVRAVGLSKQDSDMDGVKNAMASLKEAHLKRNGSHDVASTVFMRSTTSDVNIQHEMSTESLTPPTSSDNVKDDVEVEVEGAHAAKTMPSTIDLDKLGFTLDSALGDQQSQKGNEKTTFTDFRCQWRESGLMGETNSYGLRLRYYNDGKTGVKIDGVEGEWTMTQMDGQYGPIDRYDLFVGGKVKVFGRWLTITSASASVCHGITVKAKRMKKMIAKMQERVEGLGSVPIVRRSVPSTTRHIVRSAQPEGHENLRKLLIDVTKLSEQLCDLGMASAVKSITASLQSAHS